MLNSGLFLFGCVGRFGSGYGRDKEGNKTPRLLKNCRLIFSVNSQFASEGDTNGSKTGPGLADAGKALNIENKHRGFIPQKENRNRFSRYGVGADPYESAM